MNKTAQNKGKLAFLVGESGKLYPVATSPTKPELKKILQSCGEAGTASKVYKAKRKAQLLTQAWYSGLCETVKSAAHTGYFGKAVKRTQDCIKTLSANGLTEKVVAIQIDSFSGELPLETVTLSLDAMKKKIALSNAITVEVHNVATRQAVSDTVEVDMESVFSNILS